MARSATPAGARPVVWVVGASSGIGAEIARSFAAIGATVCLSGRRRTLLERLRRGIEAAGGRAFAVPFDVTDARATKAAWKSVRKMAGPVDVLVNNAGVTVFSDFLHTSPADFDAIVSTNLLGPVHCLQAALPEMVRRRRGWVFNILSNAAVKTFEGSAAYTATKAGMLGFGRVLREEMRAHRVKVVSILPGATDTPMWSPTARRKYRARMMSARGVAEAVVSAYLMPPDVVVDEMIIRPIGGDLG